MYCICQQEDKGRSWKILENSVGKAGQSKETSGRFLEGLDYKS
jgi:hypothetical protein